jgi:hypothetical protein
LFSRFDLANGNAFDARYFLFGRALIRVQAGKATVEENRPLIAVGHDLDIGHLFDLHVRFPIGLSRRCLNDIAWNGE